MNNNKIRLLVVFGVLCTLIVASGAREVASAGASAPSATWLEDGYGDEIQEIVGIFSDLMNQTFASGFPWLRQAHAKQHGCAQAIVTPLAGLNETLAQGVFATPEPIAAFIRFSNGVGRGFAPPGPIKANESDIVPDIRGFAVKLVNVTTDEPFLEPNANTQVFTLTTDHQGFLPDVATALSFFKAVQSGVAEFALWSAENPESAVLFFQQAVIIDDLLTADWFSPVPSRHGDTFVKHHIYNPSNGYERKTRKLEGPSPKFGFDFNYLTQQLVADLDPDYENEGYNLRWAVQLYVDEYETPVNDSTIVWEVPFVDIADIYIPPQNSFNDAQNAFCTYMSFNPGFSIPTHAPYGPIQEIRMAVYQAMATLRHALQGQPNTDATYQDWLNFPTMGA